MTPSTSLLPSKFLRRAVAALLFLATLGGAPPRACASRTSATKYAGVVQTIDYKSKTINFQPGPDGKPFQLGWYWDTTFIADGKRVKADALKNGTPVKVDYHVPLFGRPYLVRVEWTSPTDPAPH